MPIGVGPLLHLLASVLDRGVIQLLVAGSVPLGELDELGEDLAAHFRPFVRHSVS